MTKKMFQFSRVYQPVDARVREMFPHLFNDDSFQCFAGEGSSYYIDARSFTLEDMIAIELAFSKREVHIDATVYSVTQPTYTYS